MRNGVRVAALQEFLVFPGYLLLFLMLVFPMVIELLYVKAALFALVLFIVALATLRNGRLALHPAVAWWTLFMAVVSLLLVLEGIVRGAPGAVKQAQVYVLWPIIYVLSIAGAANLRTLRGLERVVILATIFAGAYGIDFVLTRLGVLPPFMYIRLFDQGEAIGLHEGYLAFNLYFVNSLPFLVPFALAALVTNTGAPSDAPMRRLWLWAGVTLGLAVVLVSGRRGLMIVTALSPAFILAFTMLERGPNKVRDMTRVARLLGVYLLLAAGFTMLLTIVYHVNMDSVIAYFSRAVDWPRQEQFPALVNGWAQHPFLGAGHGASAAGSIRSESMPWAYELFYVALLFQTGVLGVAAYTSGVLWIYVTGMRIIRKGGALSRIMLPTLVGTSCFLIANAADPYLARFDGIWVIFLPLAVINCWLLSARERRAEYATGASGTHVDEVR